MSASGRRSGPLLVYFSSASENTHRGDIIASKLDVPLLYRYELLGTNTDVARVKEGLEGFWQTR